MSKIQNEEPVDEDSLTAHEREYLTTPVSKLTQDQRITALAIREKRDNKRWADNAAAREKERATHELVV